MFDASAHILVTGGTGFFGLALLRHWQSWAHGVPRVTVLSRNPQRFKACYPELAALVDWVEGDVLDTATLPWKRAFTHVLHAATDSTHGGRLSPAQRYTQIVQGTQNALELAVGTGAARFLLTSSGGVYGAPPVGMGQIPENYLGMPDPLNTNNAYSVAKRCAEHLCALCHEQHGLATVIARCFAFVGPDLPRDVHFSIGNFLFDALHAPEITVQGDGTPVRSYMDQRDLAQWISVLLAHGRALEAYNVGSDQAIAIKDLAFLVRDLLAPEKPVRIVASPAAQSARNWYVPAIDKARGEFGLQLSYTLPESIVYAAQHGAK